MTLGLRQYVAGYTVAIYDVIKSDVKLHLQVHYNVAYYKPDEDDQQSLDNYVKALT